MDKKKGSISFNWIIENCIETFNSRGLDITLNQLASELGISRGRISHYFPTKELLLVAISQEYEKNLEAITSSYKFSTKENFLVEQLKLYSLVMDNQYRFRCVMIYAAGTSSSRSEMVKQINNRFSGSKERFRLLTVKLTELGYLDKRVLESPNFDVFRFKFITVFTSWVVHYELYDKDKTYKEVKSIYLEAIGSCFLPYALPKAKEIISKIDFSTL